MYRITSNVTSLRMIKIGKNIKTDRMHSSENIALLGMFL